MEQWIAIPESQAIFPNSIFEATRKGYLEISGMHVVYRLLTKEESDEYERLKKSKVNYTNISERLRYYRNEYFWQRDQIADLTDRLEKLDVAAKWQIEQRDTMVRLRDEQIADLTAQRDRAWEAIRKVWFDETENRCRFCLTFDPCAGSIERCDHSADCIALEAQKEKRSES